MSSTRTAFALTVEQLGQRRDIDSSAQAELKSIMDGLNDQVYLEGEEETETIPYQLTRAIDWFESYHQRRKLSPCLAEFFGCLTMGLWSNENRLEFWTRYTNIIVRHRYQENRGIDPDTCSAYMIGAGVISFNHQFPSHEARFLAQVMRLPATDGTISRIISTKLDRLHFDKAIIPEAARLLYSMSDHIAAGFRYPEQRKALMILAHCYMRDLDDCGIRPLDMINQLGAIPLPS